jgi:hypothetical protein
MMEAQMDELRAKAVANALGGESWQSGGGIWLVLLRKDRGRLVVISDEAICEYEGEASFDQGRATSVIIIT